LFPQNGHGFNSSIYSVLSSRSFARFNCCPRNIILSPTTASIHPRRHILYASVPDIQTQMWEPVDIANIL
jgi:hypothetical protein